MIKKIAKLYDLEREIKQQLPAQKKILRQLHATPLLTSLKTFIDKINAPPTSLLGKAVTYCKNQWSELIRYIDYGETYMSNCLIENQVRPFAVGKRNWLFVGLEIEAPIESFKL